MYTGNVVASRRVPLGELCSLVNGDAYRETDWRPTGVPIVRIQNLNDASKPFNYWQGRLDDRVNVNSGDVLLAWSGTPGTSFGAHLWNRGRAVLNQHIFRVDLDLQRIDARYAVLAINEQLDELIGRAHGAVGLRHVTKGEVESLLIPLPELRTQQRVATAVHEQLALAAGAESALEAQLAAARCLPSALTAADTEDVQTILLPVTEALEEVTAGIGDAWKGKPVLGATRAGLAPAKEGVGKQPHRYKPVVPGTVFYNPMRILLGSIALVDDSDSSGITSPDYVVIRGREGVLHPVWFYHWFRSPAGAEFIQSLTRGAVRERLLFNRLAAGRIPVPPWHRQLATVERLRAADLLRRQLASRLNAVEALPSVLLRRAFSTASETLSPPQHAALLGRDDLAA